MAAKALPRFAVVGAIMGMTMIVFVSDASVGSASDVEETTTTSSSLPSAPPRVLLVGDSTMAGLRWFRDGTKVLTGATFVVDVESCRSVAGKSCYGRENRIPTNVVSVIRSAPGPFDAVVLMAGTHNDGKSIEAEFKQVHKLTARMGTKLIVLTLRDFNSKATSVSKKGMTTIASINQMLVRLADSDTAGNMVIADWKAFTRGRENWFRKDGVHLNLRGVVGLEWYISQVVAHTLERPCSPMETEVCRMPIPTESLRDWVRYFDIKYTDVHCYEDGRKRTKVCERDRRMP